MARSGPKHTIITAPKIIDNFLPTFPKISLTSPLHLAAAIIDSIAKPTSAKTNPNNPLLQLIPDSSPKNVGNIRFPAPKNIANKAKPITIASLVISLVFI